MARLACVTISRSRNNRIESNRLEDVMGNDDADHTAREHVGREMRLEGQWGEPHDAGESIRDPRTPRVSFVALAEDVRQRKRGDGVTRGKTLALQESRLKPRVSVAAVGDVNGQ